MSDILVTANTTDRIERIATVFIGLAKDGAHELLVTTDTVLLQDLGVGGRDLDRFVEVLKGETARVAIAVVGLANPLADAAFRDMAIVARGVVVMARNLPAVVLVAHDVAIDARLRIIAHVRQTVGEMKRVRAETAQHSQKNADDQRRPTKEAAPNHVSPL